MVWNMSPKVAPLVLRAGDSHLGSRTERMSIKDRQAQVSVVEQADKRARFDAALGKANWASQALRQQPVGPSLQGSRTRVHAFL